MCQPSWTSFLGPGLSHSMTITGHIFTQTISQRYLLHLYYLYHGMPPSTRQTHATLANAPSGSHAPLSNHSDSHQRSERGGCSGSPFDFMAKVPSPIVTTPTTPEVAAVAPAAVTFVAMICCNPLSTQPNSSYVFPIS